MPLSLDVLRIKDFRFLIITRSLITCALIAQYVIIGWQVYSITKDVLMLGLTGLVEAVPAITCALFAGHFIDIGRPYKIILACLAGFTVNCLILFIVAGGLVQVSSDIILILSFAAVFISGITRSFLMPSFFAILSQIVSRGQIPAASGWFTSVFQISAILGPAIAGLVYGSFGAFYAWMIPLALSALALISAMKIDKKHLKRRLVEKREATLQSIKTGWRFILQNRVLLSIMILDMFAVLFGGAVAMLPAFADQVLHVGSEGLGILRASTAVGSIVVALAMSFFPMKRVRGIIIFPVVAAFGLCMIGFGLSTSFWLAALFLILSGMFDSFSMIMRATIIQLTTPYEMRGRISAIGLMFVISSNEIGAFESGVAAKLMGLVPSIVFGGVCTLIVVAVVYFLSPSLRKIIINPN